MDIEQIRREYLKNGLHRSDLAADPIEQFDFWLQQAVQAELVDPTAMTLATVAADGRPSQRCVLLKGCDKNGLVFYTNLQSRKANEISENNNVSLHFPWLGLDRQVMICGRAEKLSVTQTLKYFLGRPRDSQIAAWTSAQSRTLSSRQMLEQNFARMKQKYQDGEVPLPSFWGGYRVRPSEFEFWQGRASRLHDRFHYSLQQDNSWSICRLAP